MNILSAGTFDAYLLGRLLRFLPVRSEDCRALDILLEKINSSSEESVREKRINTRSSPEYLPDGDRILLFKKKKRICVTFTCTPSHLKPSCTRRTYRSTGACNACPGYRLVPTTWFDLSPTTASTGLTNRPAGLHASCLASAID